MSSPKIKRFLIGMARDFLILVTLGNLLPLFIIPLENWNWGIVVNNCLFALGIGYPAMKGMAYIGMVLERKLPWLKYPVKRMIASVVAMYLFASLIIFAGFAVILRLWMDLSISDARDHILPSLKVVYSFLFLSILVGNMVLFFKNWKKATIQQEELKRAHLISQNESLRNQLQPHFLFNSLSSLTSLIRADPDAAEEFVHKLSDVYRYVLKIKDLDLVSLEQEEKFLDDYMYLQKIRFGSKLKLRRQTADLQGRMLLPLSLQMLVENAIKHNELSQDHPLEIQIGTTEGNRLVVRNQIRKKQSSEASPGIGLENLKKRIAVLSEEKLTIQEDQGIFEVSLPTFTTD